MLAFSIHTKVHSYIRYHCHALTASTQWAIFDIMVIFSCFPGLGFGTYCAVDFALVMDVLPSDKDKAKDLAVWHEASTL